MRAAVFAVLGVDRAGEAHDTGEVNDLHVATEHAADAPQHVQNLFLGIAADFGHIDRFRQHPEGLNTAAAVDDDGRRVIGRLKRGNNIRLFRAYMIGVNIGPDGGAFPHILAPPASLAGLSRADAVVHAAPGFIEAEQVSFKVFKVPTECRAWCAGAVLGVGK